MNQLPDCSALRSALDTIANSHTGPNVRLQIGEIEQLRERFKHAIEVVMVVDEATPRPDQFTCFMHALDLVPPPLLVAAIMQQFDLVIPGSEFIKQLIELEYLVPTTRPKDGDILIYFDRDRPKHAGKCMHGIVESKWGLGHIWRQLLANCTNQPDAVSLSTRSNVPILSPYDKGTSHWGCRVGADSIAALARSDA